MFYYLVKSAFILSLEGFTLMDSGFAAWPKGRTGGEALGQNIASSLTRSCLEGSTPASHGTALQAAGSKLPADSEGFAPGY